MNLRVVIEEKSFEISDAEFDDTKELFELFLKAIPNQKILDDVTQDIKETTDALREAGQRATQPTAK